MFTSPNAVAYLPNKPAEAANTRQHNPAMYVYHEAQQVNASHMSASVSASVSDFAPNQPNHYAWNTTEGLGASHSRNTPGRLAEYRPYEDGIHARPRSPEDDEDGSTPRLL